MNFIRLVLFCAAVFCPSAAFAQSGGTFQITQSVIAGGGETVSGGGVYALGGTTGQDAVGGVMQNGAFELHPGFWTPALIPTAANVSLSGRVLAADGRGIKNAVLTLINSAGEIRTARSGTFGYYRFDNIAAGEVYTLTISAKRFVFINPMMVLTINEELANVDFTAAHSSL